MSSELASAIYAGLIGTLKSGIDWHSAARSR